MGVWSDGKDGSWLERDRPVQQPEVGAGDRRLAWLQSQCPRAARTLGLPTTQVPYLRAPGPPPTGMHSAARMIAARPGLRQGL